jgi:regulator of sigma E protease
MITILAFLFVLGVLIFVHELGHFLVARFYGVRVLRFSLGFDPRLVTFRRGGTEYSIGVIPLGGFVKLSGETVEDQRTGAPDEFLSQSKWVRFQVYLAGPVMNMLLAVMLLTFTLSSGADVPVIQSQPAVIGEVAAGSPAEAADLRPGDQVVRIGETQISTWEDLEQVVMPRANQELTIDLVRDGQTIQTRVTPESVGRFELGSLGIAAAMRTQLMGVNPGSPAERAGLRAGDVLVAVNGREVTQSQLLEIIHASAGESLTLTVRRDGATLDVVVVPELQGDIGLIGAPLQPYGETRRVDLTLLEAARMSVQRNWEMTVMIGQTLRGLFGGETPMRQLMGPVAIAELSGNAAQLGSKYLFELMAMISLNLGLINLLPIPVMDGGQIAILGFEGLTRRDLSMRVKERILLAGAALIVALMVTVIYNDIMRLLR